MWKTVFKNLKGYGQNFNWSTREYFVPNIHHSKYFCKYSENGTKTLIIWNNNFFSSVVLTLSWRKPLSYRNQSIDLLCKSMEWFLYDNGLRHERIKISVSGYFKNYSVELKKARIFCEYLIFWVLGLIKCCRYSANIPEVKYF